MIIRSNSIDWIRGIPGLELSTPARWLSEWEISTDDQDQESHLQQKRPEEDDLGIKGGSCGPTTSSAVKGDAIAQATRSPTLSILPSCLPFLSEWYHPDKDNHDDLRHCQHRPILTHSDSTTTYPHETSRGLHHLSRTGPSWPWVTITSSNTIRHDDWKLSYYQRDDENM